ncbi:MAG: T9SS type A sorting domain-containing protein, partial [bacterium]
AGKCKVCTPPDVSITGDDPVCPNSTHTYTATTDATNPSFNWSATGGTLNGSNTGSSVSVTAGDEGTMMVSVEVTDGATNCSNSATLEVSVEDNEPPVIITFPAHISLWPPNHQYETILVAQCVDTVADNCVLLSPSDVVVDSVSSDEPEDVNGGGDGNTLNDIVIASDCKSVQLRSERQGGGNGRVYTLHLSVRDGNGNIGVATCFVIVPHSQNGNSAVNDGPAYFVFGNCNSAPKMAENFGQMSESATLPEGYALEQNYPNPFNPSTVISFQLPVNSRVTLKVFDVLGREVATLVDHEVLTAGHHARSWEANNATSGVYFYRLVAGDFQETRKMILTR